MTEDYGEISVRPFGTVHAPSDQVLVTHTDYNAAGLVQDTIDPAGIMSGTIYDLLGRRIETINAWDGTQNPTPSNSTNQITTFTLNGNGDILTQTAVMPSGTPSQTTTYVYGVQPGGTMGSNIFSNTLLAKVEYPIASGSNAGQSDTTNASDWQQIAYDDQGQKIKFQDQNGTIHGYTLDVLGRLTADVITNFGSGVDQAVKALAYNFNDAGLPFQQTSYNDTVPNGTGSDILSQVQNSYNGYGQLTAQYQSHSGAVNTSSTPKTQYQYDQSGNWSRLSNTVYPNTRGLVDDYGTSGLDYQISRVANQEDYYGAIQDYLYLGLNTIIRSTSFPWNIGLSYVKSTTESIGDAGDMYIGIDRFGRVVRQRWSYRTGLTGTGGGDTLGTVLEDVQYGYDRDGDVLYMSNLLDPNFSQLFTYDQLNRLTTFQRGTLNSSDTAIITPNPLAGSTNNWSLNAVGDITSSGGTSRSTNSQNQVTQVGSNNLTYDSNGNTLTDQAGNTYKYDAWNHIVSLNGTYAYKWDALGQKIYEGTSGHDLYYNTTGNVIEERNSSNVVTDQYVWGLMYPNQLVLRDDNSVSGNLGITGSGLGNRLYAMYDANYDVTGMVDTSGNVQQRYIYDPYGSKTLLDGAYNTISTDTIHLAVGYQGGWTDPVSGLVQFAARTYNPATGTWLQADPAGYVDGTNLYRSFDDDPVSLTDPAGTYPVGTSVVGPPTSDPHFRLFEYDDWVPNAPFSYLVLRYLFPNGLGKHWVRKNTTFQVQVSTQTTITVGVGVGGRPPGQGVGSITLPPITSKSWEYLTYDLMQNPARLQGCKCRKQVIWISLCRFCTASTAPSGGSLSHKYMIDSTLSDGGWVYGRLQVSGLGIGCDAKLPTVSAGPSAAKVCAQGDDIDIPYVYASRAGPPGSSYAFQLHQVARWSAAALCYRSVCLCGAISAPGWHNGPSYSTKDTRAARSAL